MGTGIPDNCGLLVGTVDLSCVFNLAAAFANAAAPPGPMKALIPPGPADLVTVEMYFVEVLDFFSFAALLSSRFFSFA